jgi:AcrR family transcriptional regulator
VTALSNRREQHRDGLPCRGRPLDVDLDAVILDAALALLADTGYERMTMDAVASRAKVSKATIYRRWDSKASLVVEAMRCCPFDDLDLPDTGEPRADLLAGLQGFREMANGPDGGLFNGVLTAMRDDPELARLVRERMIVPKQNRTRAWLERYVARGLLPADADVDVFHDVGMAMLASRIVITGEPVDDAFLTRVVDDVLLPLLFHPSRGGASRVAAPTPDRLNPAPERTPA